jgi:cysteinyl-tRNA synthetase
MSSSKGAGGLADLIKRQGGERIRFFLLRTHYRSTVLFNESAIEEAGIGLETFNRLFKRYTRITGKEFYDLKAPAKRNQSDRPDQCREKFLACMDDDFNTGGAIGELFELARLINKHCDDHDLEGQGRSNSAAVATLTNMLATLRELTNILGIFLAPPKAQAAGDDLAAKLLPLVKELKPGATSPANADELMKLLIQLRADARKAKDFATADKIRKRLTEIGITLEDRAGGTEWSKS